MVTQYPEHEKLHSVKEQSQAIGEFLTWIQEEKGIVLCNYLGPGKIQDVYAPTDANIEKLLAEYFGINLNVLEQEKRQMLNEFRKGN